MLQQRCDFVLLRATHVCTATASRRPTYIGARASSKPFACVLQVSKQRSGTPPPTIITMNTPGNNPDPLLMVRFHLANHGVAGPTPGAWLESLESLCAVRKASAPPASEAATSACRSIVHLLSMYHQLQLPDVVQAVYSWLVSLRKSCSLLDSCSQRMFAGATMLLTCCPADTRCPSW